MFGGALLLIVVAVSYLLSKSRKGSIKNSVNTNPTLIIHRRNPVVYNQEEILYGRAEPYNGANIYQIDSGANKEVRILRKPTATKNEIMQNENIQLRRTRQTTGNGKRYTIVNEEMKKTFKPTVINF